METKHTPGPWAAYLGGPGANPSVKSTAGNVHICSLSTAKRSRVTRGRSLVQAQADACLISAAPELLEALKSLVRLEADGKHADECAIEAWERAATTIAKAEGR